MMRRYLIPITVRTNDARGISGFWVLARSSLSRRWANADFRLRVIHKHTLRQYGSDGMNGAVNWSAL